MPSDFGGSDVAGRVVDEEGVTRGSRRLPVGFWRPLAALAELPATDLAVLPQPGVAALPSVPD
jgi:hypothetical protein